jgi:hypothetical protein
MEKIQAVVAVSVGEPEVSTLSLRQSDGYTSVYVHQWGSGRHIYSIKAGVEACSGLLARLSASYGTTLLLTKDPSTDPELAKTPRSKASMVWKDGAGTAYTASVEEQSGPNAQAYMADRPVKVGFSVRKQDKST